VYRKGDDVPKYGDAAGGIFARAQKIDTPLLW